MKDLLLDDSMDLKIANGDFVIDRSDEQQQEVILLATEGDFKQHPDVGVGLEGFIHDEDIEGMVAKVRAQYSADGMTVNEVAYIPETGKLDYDAKY
jgi:hypothetical protein